jgi:hypothetical protein
MESPHVMRCLVPTSDDNINDRSVTTDEDEENSEDEEDNVPTIDSIVVSDHPSDEELPSDSGTSSEEEDLGLGNNPFFGLGSKNKKKKEGNLIISL